MQTSYKYGQTCLDFEIPDENILGTLAPPLLGSGGNNRELIREALLHPVGSANLGDIIRRKAAANAVIVVNDITRPTPYRDILPPLLEEIEAAGIPAANIKLVVALGIHRPHTGEENLAIFGDEICRNYEILNHNCDADLMDMGQLSNGWELSINRTVAQADLLVTTGLVGLHYFAGYSGGRKSILPGVASRQLIRKNHQMMADSRACLGNYQDNPVSQLMLEAARLTGVDFIVNVVTASRDDIIFAVAGDLEQAWLQAVHFCEDLFVQPIAQKADVVVAGCGGYPKDINMYQAQKALDSAALAVREGGTIILLAECREGLGEENFEKWLREATCPEDIERRFAENFELGGHKAYAICRTLKTCDIWLYSSLPASTVRSLFFKPLTSVQEGITAALDRYGPTTSFWLMPEAPRLTVKLG